MKTNGRRRCRTLTVGMSARDVAGSQFGSLAGRGPPLPEASGILERPYGSSCHHSKFTITGSTLQFNRSKAVSFANEPAGAGTLDQAGTGLLTTSGNSTSFTGEVTLRARTLQFGHTNALSSGAVFSLEGLIRVSSNVAGHACQFPCFPSLADSAMTTNRGAGCRKPGQSWKHRCRDAVHSFGRCRLPPPRGGRCCEGAPPFRKTTASVQCPHTPRKFF